MAPVSGVALASHAAESEASSVSGVAPASQPAPEAAPAASKPAGNEPRLLPDGKTVNISNPWADVVEEVDYDSPLVKKSRAVAHLRDPNRSAWAYWKPTLRDKHVSQWVQKAHGSYVKQDTGSSGSGDSPCDRESVVSLRAFTIL